MSGPLDCVPEVFLEPVHAPEAMQPVAFVAVQVKVLLLPEATVVGEALSVTDGAAGVATVTIVDCPALPPGPVQVRL